MVSKENLWVFDDMAIESINIIKKQLFAREKI